MDVIPGKEKQMEDGRWAGLVLTSTRKQTASPETPTGVPWWPPAEQPISLAPIVLTN